MGSEVGDPGSGLLAEARSAADGLRWLDVYESLRELDRVAALTAEDLELLATAAFLCGHARECRPARLRAYQLYLHRGDVRAAARCAAQIGLEQLGVGEVAEAVGCLPVSMSACSAWAAQAAALLEHEHEEGAEDGYVMVPVAYERLVMEDDPAAAAELAGQAVAIGRRFGDPDLVAMALMIQGRALVRSARVADGVALLDEAVTLVAGAEIAPAVAGLVLTAAVDTTHEVFEVGRADEWTRALADWCDGQTGMMTFRCRSLALQAASERRHGRWDQALELAGRAREPSIAELDLAAAAAACYQQGEVWRLRGELRLAEAAYRRAGEGGLDPQPGLALLRLADGDVAAATASLDRALGEAPGDLGRARLLPARVEVLLRAGDVSAAAEPVRELEQLAREYATPVLEAAARQARAALLLAEGEPSSALPAAREARRVWQHFDLPYEEAQSRVLIARCCRMLDDEATASLELEGACQLFATVAAGPDLDAATALRTPATDGSSHGLTPRELEVLQLLATGLTNRAIADQLHVTTRTVDTHVSRILTKLGVATRAAATAFAHQHDLLRPAP
jgi:DNA-binding CsgD family transcriptional regulator/tetratricopeptide (TPR) repeat protein